MRDQAKHRIVRQLPKLVYWEQLAEQLLDPFRPVSRTVGCFNLSQEAATPFGTQVTNRVPAGNQGIVPVQTASERTNSCLRRPKRRPHPRAST
jgi:hypothetical protein